MKKLILTAVLSAFAFSSFKAAYACDGQKGQNKGADTQAKKDGKKTDEAAKTEPKT